MDRCISGCGRGSLVSPWHSSISSRRGPLLGAAIRFEHARTEFAPAEGACGRSMGLIERQPRSPVRQTFCNKASRSRVERRPRSNACVSKKTCADLRPSSCSREKNSHSALSLEDAPSSVNISLATRWMRMPAHCAPLAVARIGDLPKHGDHAQLLQQDGVEGHLVHTVENLGRRARAPFTLDWVDLNKNGILRFALLNEGRDRGIAGITSVPVGLAVNLYGLEHGGQTSRGEQNVRC